MSSKATNIIYDNKFKLEDIDNVKIKQDAGDIVVKETQNDYIQVVLYRSEEKDVNVSMIEDRYTDDELYQFYLSLDAEKDSTIKQSETIKKIASEENCVIVGRGADYILKDYPNLVRIFLYAPLEYRINKIKEMYNDTDKEAKKHILASDKSRASYYEAVSNQIWTKVDNYDLCINCKIGNDKVVNAICHYIEKIKKIDRIRLMLSR